MPETAEQEQSTNSIPRCPRCGEPATAALGRIRLGGKRELWCSNAHPWLWADPSLPVEGERDA